MVELNCSCRDKKCQRRIQVYKEGRGYNVWTTDYNDSTTWLMYASKETLSSFVEELSQMLKEKRR